jgi:hypothetical protein
MVPAASAARSRSVETNRPVEAVVAAQLKPGGGRSRLPAVDLGQAWTWTCIGTQSRGRTSQSSISGCRFASRSGRLVGASSGAAATRPKHQCQRCGRPLLHRARQAEVRTSSAEGFAFVPCSRLVAARRRRARHARRGCRRGQTEIAVPALHLRQRHHPLNRSLIWPRVIDRDGTAPCPGAARGPQWCRHSIGGMTPSAGCPPRQLLHHTRWVAISRGPAATRLRPRGHRARRGRRGSVAAFSR